LAIIVFGDHRRLTLILAQGTVGLN